MKVLLGCNSLLPPIAGIGAYTQALYQGLVRDQRIQKLHCFFNTEFIDPEVFFLEDERKYSTSFKMRVLRKLVSYVPGRHKAINAIRRWQFGRRIANIAGKGTIYHEPVYVLRPFPGPSVATIHDLSHIHFPHFHPKERVRIMERGLPITLEKADHLITDSEFVRREVIDMLGVAPDRVTAVALGVHARFHPRNDGETLQVLKRYELSHGGYLLAVSTLEPRKNLIGLVRAYERLSAGLRKRFPLVLVGSQGWLCKDLEQVLSPLESRGEVRRLGYVPADDLPCLYSGAAAFAYPSFYEGFGLPPLEAMASGIPLLASSNSAMAEVAGDAGMLVDPDDGDDIAFALEQMLEDETLRKRLSERGLERAAHFSWEKCVEETIAVYRKVLGKN